MRRRDAIKGLTVGTAAGVALPAMPARETLAEAARPLSRREPDGPLVERHGRANRVRSGMALGGIGAGFFELRKDGRFHNWSIFNNFPKETGPELRLPVGEMEDPAACNLFFKVRYEVEGEEPRIVLLQLSDGLNEGGLMGIAYYFPWMEAADEIESETRFPFTRLRFSARDMPFDLVMTAWTPFIPHDLKNSALPAACFDFELVSRTDRKVHVLLMMAARNLAGYEAAERHYLTEIRRTEALTAVSMGCGGMDPKASSFGQIGLASLGPGSSYYCGWAALHPYYEYVLRHRTLPDLDDTNGTESLVEVPAWMPRTNGRNITDPAAGRRVVQLDRPGGDSRLFCTLGRSLHLSRRAETARHTFAYAWSFPNLYASRHTSPSGEGRTAIEGHYYSNFFASAFEVIDYVASERDSLEARSKRFLDDFFDSSLPVEILEQVNSQLNTLVTSGRLVRSGDFGMLEGLASTWSWGPIATMDVMLYGTLPIIALFPELQKSTMRAHAVVQNAAGQVAHGLHKDFRVGEDGTAGVSSRLDLPGQFVMLVLRDFFWTGDRQYLADLYPAVQKAIDYVLRERAFPDAPMPLMRGIECSYDNFPMYGTAAYLASQWLCALACASEAAEVMGDRSAMERYLDMMERTRERMEARLWNGQYYRLYDDSDGAAGRGDTSEGCLTDQIVGQWAAHQSGLGYLLDRQRVDSALKSILAQSFRPGFGLRNCSWPGRRWWSEVDPNTWVDQGNTCWSGVELAFASFLLYEGLVKEAFEVVRTVDQRYRRNGLYFDHQEFGGHYFRALSAWGIVNGALGFSVKTGKLRFDPKIAGPSFRLFFATPTGTGHYLKAPAGVTLACRSGELVFEELELPGLTKGEAIVGGRVLRQKRPPLRTAGGALDLLFDAPLTLRAGESVALS